VYVFFKRMFDLISSLAALLLVSPLFIIVIPILKFTGEGWVFFIQERVGLNNKHFGLIKFSTMLRDSPKTGTITAKNDPRILPVGRYLRITKINELPQIINVIKGDMSIVGPRPLTDEGFQYYPEDIKEVILKMKPGLTGMGSIILRNEEDILYESKKEKMRCYAEDVIPLKGTLEKWYFEHRSFWLDLKIVAATAVLILLPRTNFYIKWFQIEPLLRASSLCHYYGFVPLST
jgi:lipopolysaccharide/colanic/teichoic acid biosynthesis glycosyltransferase